MRHVIEKKKKQQRYKIDGCTYKTISFCGKCQLFLCFHAHRSMDSCEKNAFYSFSCHLYIINLLRDKIAHFVQFKLGDLLLEHILLSLQIIQII